MTCSGYSTELGRCLCGDSLVLMNETDDESIDLVITSPPFALQRMKEYGNHSQDKYISWFCEFGEKVYRKLKLRAKNSVNTIWWLCKNSYCKADISRVLVPYSPRMKKMIANPRGFVKSEGTERPSGHVLGLSSWTKDNGGAIPSNMLQIPNTESNSQYLRFCRALGIKEHPARFPAGIPEFFIKFLTDEGDLVLDIFAGSNTTGHSAERLGRHWISFEIVREYAAASALRLRIQ